jgi:APA family basic amino acid/polyamine antiporter
MTLRKGSRGEDGAPKRELTLFDSVSLIVGIIVGAGIYETSPLVASSVGSAGAVWAIWLVGGLLALAGALCYAELATTYPDEGGDYVYLRRAYGPWAGFLFGWSQLVIVRPADIALMAFVFARYAQSFHTLGGQGLRIYATLAIVVLTLINILGVRQGKWTQNLLTVAKTLGLVSVVVVGFLAPSGPPTDGPGPMTLPGVQLALILVLFTFGGWNEMAYVAAEVKDPCRNIVRALVIGTASVTALYLLINGAFLHALGFTGLAGSSAVAVDTVAKVLPGLAGRAVAVLICISALGAVNGLTFSGARISYALGQGHTAFGRLGRWHGRLGTPAWALAFQGIVSVAIALAAGSFYDTILYTAPVFWLFFLATGISVFVLRSREPDRPRSYKVSGFPWTTILFCGCCAFMLYSCIGYAWLQKPMALAVLAGALVAGALTYVLTERPGRSNQTPHG